MDKILSAMNKTETVMIYWTSTETIILTTILGALITVGFFGNLMILIIFLTEKCMRTKTNIYIVNLTLADFLTATLVMPITMVTLIRGSWVFDDLVCSLNGVSIIVFLSVSIHTLMYISLEKYIIITKPHVRSISKRKIYLMIAAAWIWSITLGFLGGYALGSFTYKDATSQCGPRWPNSAREYSFAVLVPVTVFIIPLAIMTFTYICIFKEIKSHLHRLATTTTMDHDILIARKKRAAVTVFMALVVFVISWTPFAIYIPYSIATVRQNLSMPYLVNPVIYILGFANSALNPILFGFRIPALRKALKKLWYKIWGKNTNNKHSNTITSRTPGVTPQGTPMSERVSMLNKSTQQKTAEHKEPSDRPSVPLGLLSSDHQYATEKSV